MFAKKLMAAALSLGILSVCSMGVLAGTVSGTGRSSGDPNHQMGAIDINYSITTKYNNSSAPSIVNRMVFNNVPGGSVNSYIDEIVYMNDQYMPIIRDNGGDTSYIYDEEGELNGMMACVLKTSMASPDAVDHIYSTFHYSTSYFGSFTGGLVKYGFDS